MAMNQFKSGWKKELDQLNLTNAKKEQIIKKIHLQKHDRKPKKSWGYPIVLTTFITLALMFIIINSNQSSIQYVTASEKWDYSFSTLNLEIIGWSIALFLVMNMTFIFLSLSIIETERWQSVESVKWMKRMIGTRKRLFFFHAIFACIIFAMLFLLMMEGQLLAIQITLMLFITVGNCAFLLWSIRKCEQTSCPYCNHTLSRKDKSMIGRTSQCAHCGEKIYYDTQASVKYTQWTFFIPFMSHFPLFIFLDFAFVTYFISFIIIITFHNLYILKYSMVYSKEDKPLW